MPIFCFCCLVCCFGLQFQLNCCCIFLKTELKASFIFHLTNCLSLFLLWLCVRCTIPLIHHQMATRTHCSLTSNPACWCCCFSCSWAYQASQTGSLALCTVKVLIVISVKYFRQYVYAFCPFRMLYLGSQSIFFLTIIFVCDSLGWISFYNQDHFVYKYPGEQPRLAYVSQVSCNYCS